MAKKQKDYELINRNDVAVMIKAYRGKSPFYPYDNRYDFMEVDSHLDHGTMKLRDYSGEERWTYRLMMHENDPLANWQGRENAVRYFGEEAIINAEKQVRKNLCNLKKELNNARLNPVWLQLKPVADELIKHYMVDFEYYDCLTLQRYKPQKFIWLVRETGTYIVISKVDKEVLDYVAKEGRHKVYWYNGVKLKEITIDDAMNLYKTLPEKLEKDIIK